MSQAVLYSGQRLLHLLGAALGVKPESIRARVLERNGADGIFEAEGHRFVLEAKSSADAASIDRAIHQLRGTLHGQPARAIGVVVVPSMGEVGRRKFREAGLGWLDLAGNASLRGRGLRIDIQGRPNLFRRRGRPADLFAPKSSRVARWLLLHPKKSIRQGELAKEVRLGQGFVSRIARQLEVRELVLREDSGAVKVRDAGLLLEAWRERYDFSRHEALKGVVAARSGNEALQRLASVFKSGKVPYAATGLGAAWLLSHFAGFRRVTFYLKQVPSASLLEKIGFCEEEAGANVWLVLPNDEGVFLGEEERDGVRCVSPLQAYLDLKGHPERAEEAAERLRVQYLNWSRHA